MQVFRVTRAIETESIKGVGESDSKTIGDIISPDETYILTDDLSNRIYICHMPNCPLVDYIIAKRLAQEIKQMMRGFYSIEEILNEGDLEKINSNPISSDGKIVEIYNPIFYSDEEKSQIEKKYELPHNPNWWAQLKIEDLTIFKDIKLSEIKEQFLGLEEIPGYKSEMLLIGRSMYNKDTQITSFLGKEGFKKEFRKDYKKIGNLTEGFFFLPEYSSRLLIKNGKLQGLEFLKDVSDEYSDENEGLTKGLIHAPVLIRDEITPIYRINTLKESFDYFDMFTVDELIERAKEFEQDE